MDSITQAVLGIVVADRCLGQPLGRKAAWWGLALGTLPDLDVIAFPWMDALDRLQWHRGESHSLLVMFCAAPIITWMWRKIHGDQVSWLRGLCAAWLIWATHVLIDCFNVYGTGVWEPFSSNWVSLNLLFIIDPIFTGPLLVAGLAALAWSPHRKWRQYLTIGALVLPSLYVFWSIGVKGFIHERFQNQLQNQSKRVKRMKLSPTVGNTFLWRCVAEGRHEGESGFWIGYASIWDDSDLVSWRWVPQESQRLGDLSESRAVRVVSWFSQGWYIVRQKREGLLISDIRFGEVTATLGNIEGVERPWVFNFLLQEEGRQCKRLGPTLPEARNPYGELWLRIWGQKG